MAERDDLVASIVKTTADYHASPSRERVESWVCQFDDAAQLPILHELDHVLKRTYFSRSRMRDKLKRLIHSKRLVNGDPHRFWRNVKFLRIQARGNSQMDMLQLLDEIFQENLGFGVDDCGSESGSFAYIDDAIYTGNHVRHDLEAWIETHAPCNATVYVISIALHSNGKYYAGRVIKDEMNLVKKKINVKWCRSYLIENRRKYRSQSDVLWPSSIPDDNDVKLYVDGMEYPPTLRIGSNIGRNRFFSCDSSRCRLEHEFFKAGVRIRGLYPNLHPPMRPLGYMNLDTLGFGSLLVFYRNCPNNAPLALWFGLPPWIPLFPRIANSFADNQLLVMQNGGNG